jgi:uncharacterized protein DUF5916
MLALFLLLQGAATAQIDPAPPVGELRALRITAATPSIDGRLTEPEWAAAPVAGRFTQLAPAPGSPASEATEVRVLYSATDLYIAMRMFDREPHLVHRALARRDEGGPSDWAWIVIDAKRDRRTAFHFSVNAAGARMDRYRFNDNEEDLSWDGVWDVAVQRDTLGWTAEFRIPFTQLQIDAGSEGRIGFNAGRRIIRRNEVDYWRPVSPGTTAFVSLAGDLTGLDGVRAERKVELMPYVVGNRDASSTGLDLRVTLPGGFLLTGAVNPDFGQVEADPSQVNLGAGELFFSERRPFFTAGMDLFQFALAPDRGVQEGLFYTRRLGRAPQVGDGPDATRILGAAKLTGRSSAGWTAALLAALTAQEETPAGAVAEPRTGYAFGRVGRDLRNGLTTLALVGGAMQRARPDEAIALRHAAYTGGLQLHHRFNGDQNALRLNLTASRVEGSPAALIKTQRSSVHYFQRPDAPYDGVDSTATSLGGWGAALHLDDHAGEWRWSVDAQSRSPGLEVNDLGFQRAAALHSWQGSVSRYWGVPGRRAREATIRAGTMGELQWDGTRTNASLFTTVNATLPNFWTVTAEGWHRFGGLQPTYLRGGPALRVGGNAYFYGVLGTDPRGSVRGNVNVGRWGYYGGESVGWEVNPTVVWRAASGTEFTVGPRFLVQHEAEQWAGRGRDDGSQEITGRLRQSSLGMTVRAAVTFTPSLSLQGYAEPFFSTARWSGFEQVVAPRADRLRDRGSAVTVQETDGTYAADLDGNGSYETTLDAEEGRTARLNANLVLRWEYRTGSTFFLVWQQGRESARLGGSSGIGQGLHDLGRAAATDVLTAKLSYWFSL